MQRWSRAARGAAGYRFSKQPPYVDVRARRLAVLHRRLG
jgi:hypothetical protein